MYIYIIFLPEYHDFSLGNVSRFTVVSSYHWQHLQNVLTKDSGAYYEWAPLE